MLVALMQQPRLRPACCLTLARAPQACAHPTGVSPTTGVQGTATARAGAYQEPTSHEQATWTPGPLSRPSVCAPWSSLGRGSSLAF